MKPPFLSLDRIRELYRLKQGDIQRRLEEFRRLGQEGSEEDLFKELAFCLLTPQAKAPLAWEAVQTLDRKKLLFQGRAEELAPSLRFVRFKNKKAQYIVAARTFFFQNGKPAIRSILTSLGQVHQDTRGKSITIQGTSSFWLREGLVHNVLGMGYKEASHFLRNIGWGGDLAILDRHILRCLEGCRVIKNIPSSLSVKRYFRIEKRMQDFARQTASIPMDALDFVFWYQATGTIFK